MINVIKQIEYWKDGAGRDIETARILLNNDRTIEALFWCHLVIEKILKANIVKKTSDIPPKIHNLVRLAELSGIDFNEEQYKLMNILMIYQLEGRYPDQYPEVPSNEEALSIFSYTKELYLWLETKL